MNAPTKLDEYDAIAKTVQYYTDGAKSGRGADMQPAFHQDATIFGYADGWNGHRYTDLLTLLKANEEWKIMNKVFHEHP
jgi:hypothetical protein